MRVLVYRIGSIGDTVVALPAMWHLKSKYPNASITTLTNFPVTQTGKESSLSMILEGTDIVSDYIEYPVRTLGLRGLLQLCARIRQGKFDILIYLMPVRSLRQLIRDWLFFKLCGIPKLVGLKFLRHAQTRLYNTETVLWEHESHRLGRLISELGEIDYEDSAAWSLNLSPLEREAAGQAISELGIRPFFVLSMGAKADVKEWGEANWVELACRLTEKYPEHALVLIGSLDEYARCEKVARYWKAPTLNLCGTLPPRVSAAVLERSGLFIGHDSGPMHLAATVGTPVVAIFSARNKPGEWYPYGNQHQVLYHKTDCFGCGLVTCIVEKKKCINSITTDEVMDAITSALGVRETGIKPMRAVGARIHSEQAWTEISRFAG